MKWPVRGLLLVAAAILLALVWQAFDPRTQILFSHPSGSIVAGSMLGVSVGDTIGEAESTLAALGLDAPVVYVGGGDLYPGGRMVMNPVEQSDVVIIEPHQEVWVFRDRSWQNGAVELLVDHERVVRITWNYGGPGFLFI